MEREAAPCTTSPAAGGAGDPVVRWFEHCDKHALPEVGGKCASLG